MMTNTHVQGLQAHSADASLQSRVSLSCLVLCKAYEIIKHSEEPSRRCLINSFNYVVHSSFFLNELVAINYL